MEGVAPPKQNHHCRIVLQMAGGRGMPHEMSRVPVLAMPKLLFG
eukprot:CAMPEP_0178371052 /NCGR_PEP_ID=MMETSP0689_2-20121128/623_1 /TAXON_ID=160604 /ORGANISM="Amphidinium massartii, Strain CS-259" /LENGTH=43 /DNA_ID= /DNA_START= /DNA_END= /DNA_ORIENTATION=